jgi:hypothetical protein
MWLEVAGTACSYYALPEAASRPRRWRGDVVVRRHRVLVRSPEQMALNDTVNQARITRATSAESGIRFVLGLIPLIAR